MTVKIKSMKAICLDDDLEKLKKEVSECIEGIINYEMSSSLADSITLQNFFYPMQWDFTSSMNGEENQVCNIKHSQEKMDNTKTIVDVFEINVKKIKRIQNFELYHQYFFIRELLDENIKHIKSKCNCAEDNKYKESQALIFCEESRLTELVESKCQFELIQSLKNPAFKLCYIDGCNLKNCKGKNKIIGETPKSEYDYIIFANLIMKRDIIFAINPNYLIRPKI